MFFNSQTWQSSTGFPLRWGQLLYFAVNYKQKPVETWLVKGLNRYYSNPLSQWCSTIGARPMRGPWAQSFGPPKKISFWQKWSTRATTERHQLKPRGWHYLPGRSVEGRLKLLTNWAKAIVQIWYFQTTRLIPSFMETHETSKMVEVFISQWHYLTKHFSLEFNVIVINPLESSGFIKNLSSPSLWWHY